MKATALRSLFVIAGLGGREILNLGGIGDIDFGNLKKCLNRQNLMGCVVHQWKSLNLWNELKLELWISRN